MIDQWIWGRRPILEALRAGRVRRVLVSAELAGPGLPRQLEDELRVAGVPLERVQRSVIARIAGSQATQGIVAETTQIAGPSLESMLKTVRELEHPAFVLILDQIQDPRNLGSLLRNADAAGVDGVIMTRHHSAPLTGTVSKSSAGAVHHLSPVTVPSLSNVLTKLGAQGIWTLALDSHAERPIWSYDLTVPIAVVIGGEGRGVRRLTADRVDMLASIPMMGAVASLNASVAAGIALFEAVRQRREQ